MTEEKKLLDCSFCGKSSDVVALMIAGPAVFICNECVDVCNDVIEKANLPPKLEAEPTAPEIFVLDPHAIVELRLKAFEILSGWGKKNAEGEWVPWDLKTRMQRADEMMRWALNPDGID